MKFIIASDSFKGSLSSRLIILLNQKLRKFFQRAFVKKC